MSFLADSPAPRPSAERSEWIAIAAFAALLMAIAVLPRPASQERASSLERGVCERQSFSAANLFFLALH